MQSERIYLVWAHPRHDSLTAHIADAIHQRAMERKIQVTELDLYRRNFNPVMTPEDEPDWKNMDVILQRFISFIQSCLNMTR